MTLTAVYAIPIERNIRLSRGASRGSGKTATAVSYGISNLKEKNHDILANIHLKNLPEGKFHYMTTEQIVEKVVNEELKDVTIIFDELHLFLNSMGEEKEKVMFYAQLFYQARKLNVDIIYTLIRYMDLFNRFRQQTETELMPQKYHYEVDEFGGVTFLDMCPVDNCKLDHLIKVYSIKPFFPEPIAIINPKVVGKYYDTNEFVRG